MISEWENEMGKKLTIIVPHYHEPWEMLKYLFDSIECQRGINFEDIEVLLVNDGDDLIISKDHLSTYHFDVRYELKPWGGLSDTRNFGIDNADGEYIMFCDSDDEFLNNYGLHLVMSAIQEGFDLLYSSFVEEHPENGGWKIHLRDKDMVFCHGKVYRRQFVLEKQLRFDRELGFSEDSVFNKIASCEADVTKEITTPFYLWCWNDESTVRKNRETIVLDRYAEVMLMRTKICKQLHERGFIDEFFDSVCKCFFDCYYDFNEPLFNKPEHKEKVKAAEKEFKKFYKKFIKDFMECDSGRISRIMMIERTAAYKNGLQVEKIDFYSWLKHIKNDVKI